MKKKEYKCPECGCNLSNGLGVTTNTNRVLTKKGYDHSVEYSTVEGYFCPKCLRKLRRKLGEELFRELNLLGFSHEA